MHLALPRLHLNPRHHLLLRNQMIDPLQQPQQAPHTPAPLIQHLIRAPRFRKTDHPRWTIDLCIYRLRRHQLANILFRLFLVEIQELAQPAHLDASVVFRDDTDVVLDDALAEVHVAGVGFGVLGGGGGVEDVGGAEVRAVSLVDHGPAHEFGYSEEFEECCFGGDEGVAAIEVDAVEEVGLFVVVRGEDDVVDYSLEDLRAGLAEAT